MTRKRNGAGEPAKPTSALVAEPHSAYPLPVSDQTELLAFVHGTGARSGRGRALRLSWPDTVTLLGFGAYALLADKAASRWFVGGWSASGAIKTGDIETRSIAALDLDHGAPDDLLDRVRGLGCSAVVHETYSSTPDDPRWRVIFPLSEPIAASFYGDLVDALAEALGVADVFDAPASKRAAGKMFLPAMPAGTTRDDPLVITDQPFIDPLGTLQRRADAREIGLWGDDDDRPEPVKKKKEAPGLPATGDHAELCRRLGGMTTDAIIATMAGTAKGNRHNVLVAAAYVMTAHGAGAAELDGLADAASAAGLPGDQITTVINSTAAPGSAEFEATVSRAFGVWTAEDDAAVERMIAAQASNSVRRRFPLTDLAALVDPNRPPRQWLLEDLVPTGDHVSLVAPAGTGKSLLVLSLSVDLARGADEFIGRRVDFDGRVMLVDMENSDDDLSERLTDLGVTPDNVPDIADRLLLMHLPPLAGLDTEQGAKDLLTVLDAYGLGRGDLLILDSTQRLTEGEENSNDTMRALYRRIVTPLKRLGITVIRTDNTGHSAGDRARGASAKKDDVGVSLLLKPSPDDPDLLTLETTKHRAKGAGAGTLRFRRESDENGILRFVPITAANAAAGVGLASMLLDQLDVPKTAGQNRAWDAVKAERDRAAAAGEPFPDGITARIVEKAQRARRDSALLVEPFEDDDSEVLE